MDHVRRLSRAALPLVGVASVLGLAVNPAIISSRTDAVIAAARETAGDLLIRRDLAGLARGIDETSACLSRLRAGRDGLARRLADLEVHRRRVELRGDQARERLDRIGSLLGRLPDGEDRTALGIEEDWQRDRGREAFRALGGLDLAIRMLTEEIAGADRQIEGLQDRLQLREAEQARLRAMDATHQLRRELAGSGAVPPDWDARVDRVAATLPRPDPVPSSTAGGPDVRPIGRDPADYSVSRSNGTRRAGLALPITRLRQGEPCPTSTVTD